MRLDPVGAPRMARLLGYCGLLPFIAAGALVLLPGSHAEIVARGLLLYTLAIVSFLGGAWWGIALLKRQPVVLLASNLLVIAAWAGAWLLDTPSALLLGAGLLVMTIVLENRHPMFRPQPPYYRRLRLRLTAVAAVSLLLVSFLSGTILSPMQTTGAAP